jgi:hypothetical protein
MDADTTVFGSVELKLHLGSSTSDVFVILLLRDKTWEAKIILIFFLPLTFDFRAFFDALIMSSKFSLGRRCSNAYSIASSTLSDFGTAVQLWQSPPTRSLMR